MVSKLGGLENRLAKELVTSQSWEAIGRAVAKSVTEMVYSRCRQAFGQQAAGFERAMGSMLQQFLAGRRKYKAALGRRMEVENVEERKCLKIFMLMKQTHCPKIHWNMMHKLVRISNVNQTDDPIKGDRR